jgi:hypothetical protein
LLSLNHQSSEKVKLEDLNIEDVLKQETGLKGIKGPK